MIDYRGTAGSATARGFTLVEMMVAVAVLLLILAGLAAVVGSTSHAVIYTTGKAQEFRSAREAFEQMTQRLSQATLNTYWDYLNASGVARSASNSGTFVPASYARQSELRFISGPGLVPSTFTTSVTHATFFQAPGGLVATSSDQDMNNLLNTFGYYVAFGQATQPPFVTTASPFRYRLMEMIEPADWLSIYNYTSGNPTYIAQTWFTTPLVNETSYSHVLAENVVALVLLPKLAEEQEQSLELSSLIPSAPIGTSLAPQYTYDSTTTNANAYLDSKNQLPPEVQVTMVAIDEPSAIRLAAQNGSKAPNFGLGSLFQTASKYSSDLAQLEGTLSSAHINYHVFTASVSIRGAQWSTAQTN